MRTEEEIIKYVYDHYPELGRISRCKVAMKIYAKEQNNNWIKIKEDYSNLPKDGEWYDCVIESENTVIRTLFLDTRKADDSIWLTLDNGQLNESLKVTHYKEYKLILPKNE